MSLTTREKFRKEMLRGWNGSAREEMERKKRETERKERRKLAREIVREMKRCEGREERRRNVKVAEKM